MYYLDKELNRYGLFLKLATIVSGEESDHVKQDKIQKFLYRASCAIHGIHRMRKSENMAVSLVEEYKNQINPCPVTNKFQVSCDPLFEAYSQIPAILSSLVSMQNFFTQQVLPLYFTDIKSVPQSMKDVVKAPEKYGFNSNSTTLLKAYWGEGGKYIRDLRNVNEHWDVLISQTFYEKVGEKGRIKIFLPDNPECKSPNKFTYSDENNAIDILSQGLAGLSELSNDILEDLEPSYFSPRVLKTYERLGDIKNKEEITLALFISMGKVQVKDGVTSVPLNTSEIRKVSIDESPSAIYVRKLNPDSGLMESDWLQNE